MSYRDGPVIGRTVGGVHTFLGLPYAAPPVGDLRWRAPAPVAPWTAPRDASVLGEKCSQINVFTGSDTLEGAEDCLFLNVFTPDVAPAAPLPVIVWIHGGAFIFGRGGPPPGRLAAVSETVVVTISYRLDLLGFLAHPALTTEGAGTSGNYAILDQRAALEWVRDNIAAFGGDAGNVTVAGQSAGGFSVAVHGASPGSAGLFHRAIIHSGAPALFDLPSLAEVETGGSAIASRVGCSDVVTAAACLRGKTVEELLVPTDILSRPGGLLYQDQFPVLTPVVDGTVLPMSPAAAYAAGSFARVPFLVGSTGDEGTLFHHVEIISVPVADEGEYRAALARTWPGDADAIATMYPVASYADANEALTAVSSDFVSCMTRRSGRALSDGGVATWLYAFEAVPDGLLVDTYDLGAFHGAELVFLFDESDSLTGSVPAGARDLVGAMQGYWTRFAATGDPNGGGAPAWPSYDTATDRHMLLASPPAAGAGYLQAECDFWDAVGPD